MSVHSLSSLVAQHDDIDTANAHLAGTCRICATETDHGFTTDEVFSNSFTDAPLLSGGDCICSRCKHIAEAADYRRYHWIATPSQGIKITKDRKTLLETLLDPPSVPWMVHIVSDYLNILNGWMLAQRLNTSRERYAVVHDKTRINLDRETVAAMTAFGRELRSRDVAKRVLRNGPSAGDLEYYDISPDEMSQINDYNGQSAWDLVVTLIQ